MKKTSPWAWIPTLYFAQGLPYVAVTIISLVMYKRLGISNTELAFYTGWLNLPWVIKPLWSPFIDQTPVDCHHADAYRCGAGRHCLHHPHRPFFSIDTRSVLVARLQFRHTRHCCRRILYAGTRLSRTSTVCRHPQHFLPHRHYCRARAAYHVGRPAGDSDRQHSLLLVYHFLSACWNIPRRVVSFSPIRLPTIRQKKYPLLG